MANRSGRDGATKGALVMTFIRQGGRAHIYRGRCWFPCQNPARGEDGESTVRVRPKDTPHRGDGPDWEYEGPEDAPTLTPSINCMSDQCWHGFIRNGVLGP
jgi:hypothetical protein